MKGEFIFMPKEVLLSLMFAKVGLITKVGFNRELRMKELRQTYIREIKIGMLIFSSQFEREGVKTQKEKRKPDFLGKY
jgi:hypothetical protein